jgi:PAS domain S-box-containing protein
VRRTKAVPGSAPILEALREISRSVGGVLDPRELAGQVAERARALLEADTVFLELWDEQLGGLATFYGSDPRLELPGRPVRPGAGALGQAFQTREAVVIADYAGWPAALPAVVARGIRSAVAVPLLVADRAIGALSLGYYRACQLGADQVEALAMIAALVAPALEAARLLALAERRQAEAAAREAELRTLYQTVACGILVQDGQGRVLSANPTAMEIMGADMTWLRGHEPGAFWEIVDEDGQPLPREGRPTPRAIRSGRPVRDAVIGLVPVGGTTCWLMVNAVPVLDGTGQVQQVVTSFIDVSGRKEVEARLQALARSEKLRALGQMASGMAHDLNQALALVTGHGDLALRELARWPDRPAALRESIQTMIQAAMDGAESVARLLTFTRSPVEGEAQVVDLGALLWEVAQLTAPRWRDATQAEGRPISLSVETSGATLIQGWPSSLREAITNLVFNAVDALPAGGAIYLRAHRLGERVQVEVADTGLGMPPEVQARVFEPFFTTKGERGNGLGLAQVFSIVEQHRGQIKLDSAGGRGTTFALIFPATTAPVTVEVAEPVVAPVRVLRILAVDDEPALGRMVVNMLSPRGHLVETATSGEAALEQLEAAPYDLLISDIGMGQGMNGWELVERVRQRWPAIRCVLATGWGALIDEEDARAKGIEAVVAKPYRLLDLERLVEQA